MKALTVGGVKVFPKWAWSKEYTAHVRAHAREMAKTFPGASGKDAAECVAIKYARFLAERDGLDLSDCPNAGCTWEYVFGGDGKPAHFIKAVRFGRHTVDIPNADPARAGAWHGRTYADDGDILHGPGISAAA